jgi:TATA-box binding protein (TBP) (component of TFIID and TFIIIB)
MTVRSKSPRAIMIFFRDGHGLAQARSESQVKTALNRLSKTIGLRVPSSKLVNLVLSGSFGRVIDLDELSIRTARCLFEPEQFPAAMIKIGDRGKEVMGSALVFASGKFSITGIKNYEDTKKCIDKLVEIVFPRSMFITDSQTK